MTSTITPLIPWLRRLAGRYSDVDDADAFVAEAVIMAMRRLPHWDPERATLKTYLRPSVLSTYRAHAHRLRQPWTSIHGMSSTELVEGWRTEPMAEAAADLARNLTRDRRRLADAMSGLTPRQQTVVRLRLGEDELTLEQVGEAIGATKQAASLVELTAKSRLARRKWYDVRGERKRVRLVANLDRSDSAALKTHGMTLSVIAAGAAEGPMVSGGTDVCDAVRVQTRVSASTAEALRAAAAELGVSMSHLVRAKVRQIASRIAHNDREAG